MKFSFSFEHCFAAVEGENKFPCPHPNCKGKSAWFMDITSHYTSSHNSDVNMREVERRRRNKDAALMKVLLNSSKVVRYY